MWTAKAAMRHCASRAASGRVRPSVQAVTRALAIPNAAATKATPEARSAATVTAIGTVIVIVLERRLRAAIASTANGCHLAQLTGTNAMDLG
jgi:hypothetical protein